ncbi:MAG: phytoene desaturase family protein [Candidatus Hodarchaeales archaeon]|jgi:phytoene dehydrogenase-like protein
MEVEEMREYDIIIVGAGLAGLTAGAKLAKEGKKILLIEQHSKMGGCATAFSRKIKGQKVRFEVGLHEMDGLDNENSYTRIIFKDLEVFSNLDFIRIPEFYRFTNKLIDVTLPSNYPDVISDLIKAFPDEKEAIQTFCKDLQNIDSYFRELNLEKIASISQMTVSDYFDELTTNENLKFVLTGNFGYYHDDPNSLSWIFFARAQHSFFIGGGHFIKGGSQTLSDYLAKVITDNRGTIVRRHLVTEIITENEVAMGVKYGKKKRDEEQLSAFSKVVLANAALPTVVNKLVPSLNNTDYQADINSLEIACSLLTIYLAFSEPPANLGNHPAYSTFVLSEDLKKLKDFYSNEKTNDYSKKGFIFTDYNLIDSRLNEEGIYTATICGIDYLDHWADLNDEDYESKKKQVADILINRLNEIFPGIKDIIIFSEVATPKTLVRYTQNPEGTVYGFSQTPDQVGPRRNAIRKPPIKNLYCASAWTGSGGFTGAISGGYSCALKILKDHE